MTVQSTTSRADYTGNGASTSFAVPFYFLVNTDLLVLRTDNSVSPPATVTLVLGTDYTVSGAGNPAGGSVTMTVAPAATMAVSILRNVPYTQLVHYVPNDPFPAASHEQALDKLTMEVQQLAEMQGRALTLPPQVIGVSTQLPAPESSTLIGWNPSANALQNVDPTTLATAVAFGTAKADIFSGNGSSKTFTLTANPGAQANLDVIVGGVGQRAGIDYTWSGGTALTFTTAPPSGTNNVQARYFQGLPQGTTDSAASTYIQAGSGAVTRTVQGRLRDTVSVKDFGAIGDGVADDTAAFNLAMAASTVVYVPPGTYKITNTITIPDNTHLFGAGQHATTIAFYPGADKDLFVVGWEIRLESMLLDSHAPAGGSKGVVRLQSLTNPNIPTNVGGNNWTDPAIGGLSYRNVLRDLTVQGGQNYNIWVINAAYTVLENVRSVLARGSAGNLYVWGKGGVNMPVSTTVSVRGGEYTASFAGPGINMLYCTDSSVTGSAAEGNFGRGITLVNCDRINLSSVYCENNFALGASIGDADIVAATCTRVKIDSCLILGNNSNNAVADSACTNCAMLNTAYVKLGGVVHTLSLGAGWVVSDNALGIAQSGTQSGGRWIQYADGTAVYSKKVTVSGAINAANGNIFVQASPMVDTDFPSIFMSDGASGFVFSAAISVMTDSSAFVWVLGNGSSKTNNAIRYRLASPTSLASASVDVYITLTGRWK